MAKGLCDDPEKKREGDAMTEQDSEAMQRERFTNGKRFVATEKNVTTKWGITEDGKGFYCGLCGHPFGVGDGVRWVYANGNTPTYCNFFTCDSCDGPDVLQRRTEIGRASCRERV